MRDPFLREISEQFNPLRVDEPDLFEIEADYLLLGEGLVTQAAQLFYPGTNKSSFQLELDTFIGPVNDGDP